MPRGWPQPCESCCCPPVMPVVFKTVTRINTTHNIFCFGWWWPSGCQLCEGLFIIIPRLVTSSSRVRGKLMLFHFPSPVPGADRDQCYRRHFTESSKEDKLLKLWHPTGQAVSCFVPQKHSLIDASWYLDVSVLGKVPHIYWPWLWKQKCLLLRITFGYYLITYCVWYCSIGWWKPCDI